MKKNVVDIKNQLLYILTALGITFAISAACSVVVVYGFHQWDEKYGEAGTLAIRTAAFTLHSVSYYILVLAGLFVISRRLSGYRASALLGCLYGFYQQLSLNALEFSSLRSHPLNNPRVVAIVLPAILTLSIMYFETAKKDS
ncbi:hypothetical protein [Bdellovibrio sp. KM01]|uniref:hypothetical protein n=1 Tax=Bdellovibrio sp. KM01 TaxID=2748865 RepID=UPI0015E9A4B5|nr:hypothetical protein [Bdellovibrio sp. KM01]QLY27085.1 hypothetical protein HW988_08865 [Bdellovibrio sp. KM01]